MMANESIILYSDRVWYLDIGARNHMCETCVFWRLNKGSRKRTEKLCFSQKNGEEGTMEDVYYVPNLKSNILSMTQLLEK